MTTDTTTDIDEICDGLRHFLRSEVVALHDEHADVLDDPRRRYDLDGRISSDAHALIRRVRERSAAAGYYTMALPASIGGGGIGWEAMYRVWETIFQQGPRHWLGLHAVAHWTKGPNPLLADLPASTTEKYLPDLLAGRTSMCFGMSEPDAGSDAWMMRTRAIRTRGGWRLSGSKQWISNGSHADLAIVFAVTDPDAAQARRGGIGAFLVPTTAPGFDASSVIPMFGHLGSVEAILQLDDVFVPDDHVIGDPGEGFRVAMRGVTLGRVYNCAKAIGLARWAIDLAVGYANHRRAFDAPISSHQGVSFPLVESHSEIHAARLSALHAVRLLDADEPARTELSIAKVLSTEKSLQAIDRAMQVHGAMGFTNEVGLTEAWQIVRVVCVADGSAEILRRQIASDLFGGNHGS